MTGAGGPPSPVATGAAFRPYTQALLEDLRTSILRAFVRWSKLSPEVARNLQEWELERSGFSCFLSPAIAESDKEGLGRLIRYLFRSPVSYRQLSYDETTGMVRCRSKRGGYREWHATEFLAVLAQHVPRPRQHVVTYAGHYANAAGNLNLEPKKDDEKEASDDAKGTHGFHRYSWAELLALVWRVDPLECPKCGERMERGRTMRGEELREFLKSINRLGYPPRPPPVPIAGHGPQESLEDPFIEPDSSQFTDDTNQVPPDWDA